VKYASGIIVLAAALFAPSPAAGQTIPKDTCSVLSAADLNAVLGPGAKAEAIGDDQCKWVVARGPVLKDEINIHVRRANGARELKDWTELAMVKPVKPVAEVADEAFVSDNGRAIAFRKGANAVLVNAAGLFKQAPMQTPQAIIEAAKRIAANIK
jgi:hypothetical protein